MKTCSEESCQQPHKARGLCHSHYYAAKRKGTLPDPIRVTAVPHRISNKDAESKNGDCSVCGPNVELYRSSKGTFCRNKLREAGLNRTNAKGEIRAKFLKEQNGVCAICKNTCTYHNNLALDHDHETGEFRGLLCMSCNMGLGMFKDNTELLAEAIRYLDR